ncbi:MAG TPA: tripartite tricarboxylate transporter substrate binding protein [Thermodesulfobacteriota bacterium]|nr:tripartite tricarboxylate transporter substrate binding protein [Thermodesulfobacteriota bacterium]
MKRNGTLLTAFAFVLFFLSLSGGAAAQEKFPARPIQIIIPWAPGGGGTVNAQTLQPGFEKAIGGSVQIVNKPGGGGTIAWNYVANSPADGYTVGVFNPSFIITRYTTRTGVRADRVEPILMTVDLSSALAVRVDAPWKNFKEFVSYAKANPEKIQMGNSGIGTNYHVSALGIEMVTGCKLTHIPFKGSGPAFTALLGGHVDAMVSEISSLLPYVEGKKFRILVMGAEERNFAAPDVPSIREEGYDQVLIGSWFAYLVPKGVPRDRFKAIHDAFKTAMEGKEYREYYRKLGGVIKYIGPQEMPAFLEKQDGMLKRIIDFSGYKPIE